MDRSKWKLSPECEKYRKPLLNAIEACGYSTGSVVLAGNESDDGNGVSFSIYLPIDDAALTLMEGYAGFKTVFDGRQYGFIHTLHGSLVDQIPAVIDRLLREVRNFRERLSTFSSEERDEFCRRQAAEISDAA